MPVVPGSQEPQLTPKLEEDETVKTYHVMVTGFGPFMRHTTNPSWLAVKALHNMTISSDQWADVFGSIVVPTPGAEKKSSIPMPGAATPSGAQLSAMMSSPIVSNGKRSMGNGEPLSYSLRGNQVSSSRSAKASPSSSPSKFKTVPAPPAVVGATNPPLPPLPEPGPFNVHITTLEIPVLYEAVLDIIPGLHLKPPKLPTELPPDFPEAPESGYDFIFHIGVAGRGPLRMEIIAHKFGYNMKDASGSYCAIVAPTTSKSNIDATRGPGAHPPDEVGGPVVPTHYNMRGQPRGGFGSMGMGYNNERLGYNPAVHDPQPIPGTENVMRLVRGFGGAPYETFPDEMMTDVDVTRMVQDLKASGITQIYTSMDAGHYLCDFTYYCSLAESRRISRTLLPFMTPGNQQFFQQSSGYNPQGSHRHHVQAAGHHPSSGTNKSSTAAAAKAKPAQVLFMHCPPVNEPLSTEEVTEAIRRIVLWVCRECEVEDIKEKAQAPEEGAPTGAY